MVPRWSCGAVALSATLWLPADSMAQARATEGEPAYKIGAGDTIQLFVWREPELSRDLRVRPDGRVSIPLVGDVKAEGQSPAALARELTKELARFLTEPRVSVGVSQAASQRFFVVGRVNKSGEFLLTSRTTVLQGIAIAGGLAEYAKAERILVVRRVGSEPEAALAFNFKRLADGEGLRDNFELQPGDTIVVP